MKKNNIRRILGIDPGLASTGWGLIDFYQNKYVYIAHGVIETSAKLARPDRLLIIFNQLQDILHTHKPTEAGMETLFFAKNVSSALFVSEARGVISVCLAQGGITIGEYTPNIIKKAVVGSARANKEQVQEYVRLFLGLESIPKPDHAADALAAAITHGQTSSFLSKISEAQK